MCYSNQCVQLEDVIFMLKWCNIQCLAFHLCLKWLLTCCNLFTSLCFSEKLIPQPYYFMRISIPAENMGRNTGTVTATSLLRSDASLCTRADACYFYCLFTSFASDVFLVPGIFVQATSYSGIHFMSRDSRWFSCFWRRWVSRSWFSNTCGCWRYMS